VRAPTHHQQLDLARDPSKAKRTTKKMRAKDRPLANDFVTDQEFDRLLHAWFANIARVLGATTFPPNAPRSAVWAFWR